MGADSLSSSNDVVLRRELFVVAGLVHNRCRQVLVNREIIFHLNELQDSSSPRITKHRMVASFFGASLSVYLQKPGFMLVCTFSYRAP